MRANLCLWGLSLTAAIGLGNSGAFAQATVSGGSVGTRSGSRSSTGITAPLPDSGPTLPSRPVLPPLPGRGLDSVSRAPEILRYHWRTEANSEQLGLYLGDMKMGLYDPVTDIYRRVNVDGTLTEPVGKPWRAAPVALSAKAEPEPSVIPSAKAVDHPREAGPAAPVTAQVRGEDRPFLAFGAMASALTALALFVVVLRSKQPTGNSAIVGRR